MSYPTSTTFKFALGSGDSMQNVVTLNNAATSNVAKTVMQYCLYDNPSDFSTFTNYVSNAANKPTTQMTLDSTAYQSYSLNIMCDVSYATTKNGAGCCIMDQSGQNGGGYCLVLNTGTTPFTVATYYLTNSQFLTSLSTFTLASTYAVSTPAQSASILLGFQYFDCEFDSGNTYKFTCGHFQMRPAASFTGGFRFERGNLARFMYYDPGQSNQLKWNGSNFY